MKTPFNKVNFLISSAVPGHGFGSGNAVADSPGGDPDWRKIMHKQICHLKQGINPAGFLRFQSFLLVIALIAGMAMSLKSAGVAHAEGPNAIINLAGCTTNSLPASDDGSTASVALPFTLNFFGTNYSALYVNNNGNVTFGSSLSNYTPFGLVGASRVIIAPYFADIDTRGTGSSQVTYGATTYSGRSAFCVNWVNVGYYSNGTDKLNSFQLLLVERFDTGSGNFDIMFNYDKILFETGNASGGSGGLGGYSAHIGFSNGGSISFELPGSGVNGAFLDNNHSTGLIYNSRDSMQIGRYLFSVREGVPPLGGGTISGTVYQNSVAPANILVSAFVQVCAGNECHTTSTNANGQYSVTDLPDGSYTAEAFPPGGSSLLQHTIGPLMISGSATLAGQDIVLTGPTTLPPGTTIDPSTSSGGIPVVYWHNPLVLTTHGCTGGTASYQITQGTTVIRSGTMPEVSAGTYSASVAAFAPLHGNAHVKITLVCPSTGTTVIEGDIYIDPSGVVKTTTGSLLAGATVTLFQSDTLSGPFSQVANGSGMMSPANRNNPDITDAAGHFGWDVIAGYYKVRAEKAGCVSPTNPAQAFVETSVMQIPPPVTNLELVLNCGGVVVTTTFADVPSTYWAWDWIERLYNAGITSGCATNPLRYCPESSVTRAQMAVFLERGVHGSTYRPPAVGAGSGFNDVSTSYWAAAWIKQLAADGITTGCGGGNYCPEGMVTRGQMAVFLLRAKYGAAYIPPTVGSTTGFYDVPTTYWAAAWIKRLAAESITTGCGGGNYCPESSVTRAQMAVFLVRTFNLP